MVWFSLKNRFELNQITYSIQFDLRYQVRTIIAMSVLGTRMLEPKSKSVYHESSPSIKLTAQHTYWIVHVRAA